jgi:hypothetical protein
MINFSIGGDNGFKAESKDNDTAEVIIASAVSVSLLALAGAGAYCMISKSGNSSDTASLLGEAGSLLISKVGS